MAMNKKEKEAFEYARSFRSLRFSEHPDTTDVPAHTGPGFSTGYSVNVHRVLNSGLSHIHDAVRLSWSSAGNHGDGNGSPETRRAGSREAIPLHSTKRRALGALRRELEDRFARTLMDIDDAIAAEREYEGETCAY